MSAARTSRQVIRTEDGLSLAATAAATCPGGPAVNVVYVHGLLSEARMWSGVVEQVAPRLSGVADHLVFDQRGHGESQWPQRRSRTTLTVLARDLATVIDHSTAPVMLVGHSMGTMTIQTYARLHDRQFRSRVCGTVLFNPAAGVPVYGPGLRRFSRACALLRPLRGRGPLDAVNAAGHAVLERRFRRTRAGRLTAGAPGDPRVVADSMTALSQFAASPVAEAVLATSAVELVAGARDRVLPVAHARDLAQRIPGARASVIAEAGHGLPTTHPQQCGDVLVEAVEALPRGITRIGRTDRADGGAGS
ncbi:alpha/beta fold hydrolase [Nocardia takedensis]|uniref:alpha/beta fold hydrolase n=1 Tax=Nocardia takedensis TaxID=259390 RepID=UPI003F764674